MMYPLCRQTVTVYRLVEDEVYRQVFPRAFLDCRESRDLNKKGSQLTHSFLLVIPGSSQQVFVGDKVFDGIGPEITRQEWGRFVPANVPELVMVSHAGVKRFQGKIVHTEAGGSVQRYTNLSQNR